MSGFLQRLVAHSRQATGQSVRPRIGSRFEPASGVQTPEIDMPAEETGVVSTASMPAPVDTPGVRERPDHSTRTIQSQPSTETHGSEPPEPSTVQPVQPAPEAGLGQRDEVSHEKVHPQPARIDTASRDEGTRSEERARHSINDVRPAQPVHPRAPIPPPERNEPAASRGPAAEEIIRTIRVVHEATVSDATVDSPSEPSIVRPATDEVGQPVAQESNTLHDSGDTPQQSMHERTDHTIAPIRPRVIRAAPAPLESQPSTRRRQPAEPPIIRVTIGRIEVRAEQRQQPPLTPTHRQPARRTPALSLDDYLAKRNEGGR